MESTCARIALILCDIFSFLIILSPLLVEEWIYQGDPIIWNGSLTKTSDDSDINSGKDYLDLKDKACDEYDKLKDSQDENDMNIDLAKAMCTTFEKLHAAGVVFIFFTSLALAILVVKFIMMIFIFWKKGSRCRNRSLMVLPIIMSLIYLIGYSVWMGVTKNNYEEDCDELNDGEEQADACADDGAEAALFVVLFNICYTPVFIVAIYKKWYADIEKMPNPPAEHIVLEMRRVNLPQPPSYYQPQSGIPTQGYYPQQVQYQHITSQANSAYPPEQALANKL